MAFTATEKADARKFLGYGARFRSTDSVLERALSTVETTEPEAESQVRALLAVINQLDADIIAAKPRLKAVQVGTLTLPGGLEIENLRDLGRQYTGQIATTLGVEIRHDVWAPVGPSHRSSYYGPMGGGGELNFG